MKYSLAAIALALSLAQAAAAECVPISKVKADAAMAFPSAIIAEMGGAEARGFIVAFNAMPPISTWAADYILTVSIKDKPVVVMVLFSGGCAGPTVAVPAMAFKSLLREL